MIPAEEVVSPEEGRAILEVMAELRAEPPPTDPRGIGCLGTLLALGLLLALPWLAPTLGLGTGMARALGVVLVILFLLGGFLGVFGGGFVSGEIMGRVEDDLKLLEAHGSELPQEDLRRAAVRILLEAHVSVGPTTTSAYDAKVAARRIRDVLPYVRSVERFLLDQSDVYIYPVFTRGRR